MRIANRENRSPHKMTGPEARGIIADMESEVKSSSRRKKMAAFYATNISGKLSPEAIAVYREYANS